MLFENFSLAELEAFEEDVLRVERMAADLYYASSHLNDIKENDKEYRVGGLENLKVFNKAHQVMTLADIGWEKMREILATVRKARKEAEKEKEYRR